MNRYRFDAEISLADVALVDVVRVRAYGGVSVTAQWPGELAAPEIRVALEVTGDLEPRDAPAYVELFFHDIFLLLNLASPGSFGGAIAISSSGLRVRELSFDPRLFAYAAPLGTLPLTDVIRWYDGLDLGTRQLATDGAAVALVQLLHLACGPEREEESILRLAAATDALSQTPQARLAELRDDIARGRTPVIHPMHDDALDPRVEGATRDWLEVADAAAHMVIDALQQKVKAAV
jgi:hypothetical protein